VLNLPSVCKEQSAGELGELPAPVP
jgi:hypothetical protein